MLPVLIVSQRSPSHGVYLGKQKLLSISVEPTIADYHARRAETVLSVRDSHLAKGSYLCSGEPTIADLVCRCDVAFAELSGIELGPWSCISTWAARIGALSGFKPPLELLPMADAEFSLTTIQQAFGGQARPAKFPRAARRVGSQC